MITKLDIKKTDHAALSEFERKISSLKNIEMS